MAGDRLPSGWRLTTLGELGEVNRGRSRHRPRYAEHLYGGPYPFIQTGDVKSSGGRITRYQQTYSEAGLAQSRMWRAGTMCITIAANIAETGILTFPACFPDSVVGFVADESKCDVRFIEYTFRYLRQQIQHEASGSVQDNINLATLDRLRFPLPPLPEQRAIAHILGTLGAKIELNRRMNETLEATAQAVFKAWFVDFEPVRAKRERRWRKGESLPGLPAHLYDLFPDRLVDSEAGEIPQGWEVGTMGKDFRITMGQSPPGSTYNEEGVGLPFYQGRVDFGFRFPVRRVFCTAPTRFAERGDTLVTVRAPVGDANMAMERCCIGRGAAALRHLTGSRSYTYYFIRSISLVFERFEAEGTVFGAINKAGFSSIQCVVPPSELVERFEELSSPVDDQIERNERESRTLAVVRDALLPKLIGGEIRVKDAERFLKERGL